MSRANARVFSRPGPAPGQILTKGINQASAALGDSIIALEQRQVDMRNKREGVEQFNRNTVELTKAGIAANNGPIDAMPDVLESAQEALQSQIDKVEDPALRAQMKLDLEGQTARAMSNVLQLQNSREAGAAIAAGNDILMTGLQGIQDGSATAGETHRRFKKYVEDQTENVYGSEANNEIRAAGKLLAEEEFNSLLKNSPGAALNYPDGAFAKEWLKPRERRELKGIANNFIAGTLKNIEMRGAAIQSSALPDKDQRLQALMSELMRQPPIARREVAKTKLESWMSQSAKDTITGAERVETFFGIMDGTVVGDLPQDQSTMNKAWAHWKNSGASTVTFIEQLTRLGSDYPDEFRRDMERWSEQETLDIDKIMAHLKVMGTDRAIAEAESLNEVIVTAYGSTRRLTDPKKIAMRNALLGSPGAIAAIAAADEALEPGDLLESVTVFGAFPTVPFLDTVFGPITRTRVTFPFLSIGIPQLGQAQNGEMESIYRAEFLRQRPNFKDTNMAGLKKSALRQAAREFTDSHQNITPGSRGRNRTYYIPKSALLFNQNFTAREAVTELAPLMSVMLRDGGSKAALLAGSPIIDHDAMTSTFVITNARDGIIGFVTWDGSNGTASMTGPDDSDKFDALVRSMLNMHVDTRPNQHLAAPANTSISEMPEQTIQDIKNMAIDIFRSQNNGNFPDTTTDADNKAMLTIMNDIASENDWKP